MNRVKRLLFVSLGMIALFAGGISARADERKFGYVVEADAVLPKGFKEFEQWITNRSQKADGKFSTWDFRNEFEYGLTDRLTGALYANYHNIYSRGVSGVDNDKATKFDGISTELKYMWLSPHTNPVGVMPYFEVKVGGDEVELEEKLVLESIFFNKLIWASNITLEQEWEHENGETEKEAVLEITSGVSYPLNEYWSVGIEGRNHREFPDGINYKTQEHSAWFLGPNIHYGGHKGSFVFTVLPQVHGTPNTQKGLQLIEHEKVEVRLVGSLFFQ